MTAAAVHEPRGRVARWKPAFYAASAALIIGVAISLLTPESDRSHELASGMGVIAGLLVVSGASVYQALHSTARRRTQAWILWAVAAAVATVGNIVLLRVGTSMGPAVNLSLPDACLLLALLLSVTALVRFPATPRRRAEVARIIMDGVIFGGSLVFFASVTLFPEIAPDGDLTSRAGPLLVPVIDILIATTAFLLFMRRNHNEGAFLGFVGLGFAMISVSDFASAIVTAEVPFAFGSPFDLGWVAGYFTIAVGLVAARDSGGTEGDDQREGSFVAGTVLIFSVFMLAAVTAFSKNQSGTLSGTSAVLWLVVLGAVVVRQVSLTVDNRAMRRILENRVIERSRDLKVAIEQSELMLRSVGDGIYGVDRTGVVTLVNPAAARVLGYEPSDLIGLHAHNLFHAVQPDGKPYPEANCYVTRAVHEGLMSVAKEDNYVRADGRLIPVEVTASQTTKDGEPVGAVVVFRDITARREIDNMKDEFVSIVSHELRTPLTSIRGSLSLLVGGALGPQTPAALRMTTVALNSSIRLGQLINDILEVEQIHSGVMPMQVNSHTAREVIEQAVAQVEVVAAAAEVTVEIGNAEGTVYADGNRVQQTLINLLDNAIKFSPAHTTVTVSTRPIGQFTEFAVHDVGRGIPPDKLDSVFKRFEQVDSSDAREHGGTGLGLAISRGIIERLGGRIWAANNAGAGATMRFTLPQTEPTLAARPAVTAAEHQELEAGRVQ